MCNNEFINSRIEKYFGKEILSDKVVRDVLISFEEILNIKKNIINMFNTDDPYKIKSLIGKKINNLVVTEKDFKYALIVSNKYHELYLKCKKLLEDKNI